MVERPGLSADAVADRRSAQGPNEIQRQEPTPRWRMLARQFRSPMIGLLAAASAVAGLLGEWLDTAAILSIVVINGVIGFLQESRAEEAVLALRAMTAPRARVRRDGQVVVIPAVEVVCGDLLVLEAGDRVAADARVLEAHQLACNEAPLTGESLPTRKSSTPLSEDLPTADRADLVFAGTSVVGGAGLAEVIGIGMGTRIGRIAALLAQATDEATPLQVQLEAVTGTLIRVCLGVVSAVTVVGLLRGTPALELMLTSVSLAVAAIPEGLPAVVTVALAVGVRRLSAQRVLVRRLSAVETLGSTTVICTDKTGTLTTGQMAVREVWASDPSQTLRAAAACCDADLSTLTGDPTELAILAAAAEHGHHRPALELAEPRLAEQPFDAERRRMSILRAGGRLYVKGAPEAMLPLCTEAPEGVEEANQALASRGLRVLAVAVGELPEEAELRLLGLVGMADPPRPEAITAVAEARGAGITTVMITGDQRPTALAIAREMGILAPGEPEHERVHARVSPEDKLRIVREWKQQGAVVAMTGDGVNDAPALREAHVGIAMGVGGTEVTREAADLVLADDNYASLVAGIREGRGVFENIRKTLVYLLAGNTAELLLMFSAALVGLPMPLLPVQLLWINLVTDGLPALALVLDPVDQDALRRPPRDPAEPMLGRPQWRRVLIQATVEGLVVLAVFAWALGHRAEEEARDLAFTTLVFSELFRAFAARSEGRTLFQVGPFSNLRLIGVVALSGALQLALHGFEPTRRIFGLHPLESWELGMCAALGLLPVTALELAKLLRPNRSP